MQVEVTFDSFVTEQCCDYVFIHDGYYEYDSYTVYSGNLSSFSQRSSGTYMLIRFISDGSVTRQGFAARFRSVEGLSLRSSTNTLTLNSNGWQTRL